MKTTIENIRLEINTVKHHVPAGETLVGDFRLAANCRSASFVENPHPFVAFVSKSLRLRCGHGYRVSFNSEENRYRITLNFNPDDPDWFDFVWQNFDRCMKYVEGREN